MNVLREMLKWSKSRPCWEQDALRRLIEKNKLTEYDIQELTEICKSKHGFSETHRGEPLTEYNLLSVKDETGHVKIQYVYHGEGVNALARNQTVNFNDNLTVVYGDNAAGKSGYTRILKKACRARGNEKEILGNIASDLDSNLKVVKVKYTATVDSNPIEGTWDDKANDKFLSLVSVFDKYSEAVYLTEKTDVAFRPLGLDLFDKLAEVSKKVKERLKEEQQALNKEFQFPELPEETKAKRLLANLSALTKLEDVTNLANLSGKENEQWSLLSKQLEDSHSKEPKTRINELRRRCNILRELIQHFKSVDEVLASRSIQTVFDKQLDVQKKRDIAKAIQEETFHGGILKGTGGEIWRKLWEAARQFSENSAYPGQEFPVVDNGSRCLLCQQEIKEVAVKKLKQFEIFIASAAEKDFNLAKKTYEKSYEKIKELTVFSEIVERNIDDIRTEEPEFANRLEATRNDAKNLHSAVLKSLEAGSGMPSNFPTYTSPITELDKLAHQFTERVEKLKKDIDDKEKKKIEEEFNELDARKKLNEIKGQVLEEIARKKKIASYEDCLKETKTQGITLKNTEVTRATVTEKLKNTFQSELDKFTFKNIEVKLIEAGGKEGKLFHKLVLKEADRTDLVRVASEGEQRCISIAAFFAELSTAADLSAILFDDPVSSLDHKWKKKVAQRLVKEAEKRQVIVFTHDIGFLLHLKKHAKKLKVDIAHQYIKQEISRGAGVCDEEIPWVAMNVKERIKELKNKCGRIKKFYENNIELYNERASSMYGKLREAWERGIEEVLLDGVVERYRADIQTRKINILGYITKEDCQVIDKNITKCCEYLTGHDQAPEVHQDPPGPEELLKDIEALEEWAKIIRKRRNPKNQEKDVKALK